VGINNAAQAAGRRANQNSMKFWKLYLILEAVQPNQTKPTHIDRSNQRIKEYYYQ
jgi:hypothetical protein